MKLNRDKNIDEDLVSVIMPAYNCGEFIGFSLDSVIDQTYRNWEVIVVDDCSKDNTEEIIKEYILKDSRIKYYRLPTNSGAALARNKAIEHARGKYIAFLDSDDVWRNDKLTKQITFMKLNDYNFTCTSYSKIDELGNDLNRIIRTKSRRDYEGILKTCPGNSTIVYNAEQLGKFKIPNIKKRNDYVLWLQVIKKEKYLYGLEESLSSHRIRSNAISSKKSSLISYHWKVYREIEDLSIMKSCFLIMYWVFATLFKLR
ncbi:glycosyltransferase involved in cell wall biosynthesis [Metabacillus crassostreae]|uniref:glycosyltransferase family 2 protein n=1 Tax=Metabacillus crassostreae TaxID=929098 RepID=UPI001959A867|nr:glycosyltransferase family 2 protein [Metabacillus crassostreae]MBM7606285.1 glycosyltransferase involved in cell wall biosynthesis [Metabacillus crassostreae]